MKSYHIEKAYNDGTTAYNDGTTTHNKYYYIRQLWRSILTYVFVSY